MTYRKNAFGGRVRSVTGDRGDGAAGAGSMLAVVGALALCCGGPLLIAALAVSGIGGWLVGAGLPVIGLAALAGGAVLAVLWRRRGARAPLGGSARGDACCAPRARGEAVHDEAAHRA